MSELCTPPVSSNLHYVAQLSASPTLVQGTDHILVLVIGIALNLKHPTSNTCGFLTTHSEVYTS